MPTINNMDKPTRLQLLKQMIQIRLFEEKAAEMYTKSKIRGFLHLYVGEEAIAVGVSHYLQPQDTVLSTYREHGHALARGVSPASIMAEMYGKLEGCSRGRGGSMHLFDAGKRFYGGNAIVAGHLPMAVGMALADKKLKRPSVTCCFFGEGAAAEGEFHEAMNLSSLWGAPVLWACENNKYAMGTALQYTHADVQLEKKAAGYNMECSTVDGMSLTAVMEATEKAVEYIRTTGRPYLLIFDTYRFRAHSMFDAELYREKSEVELWKQRDPILQFKQALLQQGLATEDDFKSIELAVLDEILAAVDYAEQGSWEPETDLMKYIYA